ncbi:hypothetical protein QJS10_CPA05g00583 [Acorus calamus]|uniref:Uncharacterized protein n=1 Tax=Acorus calamus TaxID=4465 RepID=A0AAV9EVH2_ACOCL|nr:hypothetical protein QJS10_CPA05g00583 [Acorus calamus]
MSSTTRTIGDKTFKGLGNLIKLLPSGTVFAFQYLSPVLTNNGKCHTINKYLSGALLIACGFSCCFSSFTDSYTDSDGKTHYGIASSKGLWTFGSTDSGSTDLSKYKLGIGDFAHALLALLVFVVIALFDANITSCYYPSFEQTQKTLIQVLPAVVGGVSGVIFMLFPNTRHGIGYPPMTSTS